MRLFKIPKIAKYIYHKRIWGFSVSDKSVYLTFDDGPNPEITPFILNLLYEQKIKATFFCVGENVLNFPEIFERIKNEGHQIGNHTFKHENALKVSSKNYLFSIEKANKLIKSKLFRPPYGRLSPKLAHRIAKRYTIIMWTWLSYDYDQEVSISEILQKAKKIKSGDILVLHDNKKIAEKQKILLPQLLKYLKDQGYEFKTLMS